MPETYFQFRRLLSSIYELVGFISYELDKKDSIVLLSKSDLIDANKQKEIVKYFKSKKIVVHPISSFTKLGLSYLIELLSNLRN